MTRPEYEIKIQNLHKEVYRLSKAGYNKQEIADATGYSKGYVERILYAMNGPAERRTLSKADKERIIKLRGEGKTIQKIAEAVGFSAAAVQRCLKIKKEEEKSRNEEPDSTILGNVVHILIPSRTVFYETVREEGMARKIKWTLIRQYPYHAMFENQYGRKRCFPNAELMNKGIYK